LGGVETGRSGDRSEIDGISDRPAGEVSAVDRVRQLKALSKLLLLSGFPLS
jgi:hypothetical protein